MANEYECDFCDAAFDSQTELEQHAREEHGKESG